MNVLISLVYKKMKTKKSLTCNLVNTVETLRNVTLSSLR